MSSLIRAELLKLRSVRAPWILAAALLAILAVSSVATMSGPPETFGLSFAERLQPLVGLAGIANLFAFGLGVMLMAGEYRHATIRQTLLTTPVRGRVLAAKLAAAVPAGVALAAAALAVPLAIGIPWLALDGIPVDLTDVELLLDALATGASIAVSAPLGVALAALIRRQSVTVVVYVLWLSLGEGLVDRFFSRATPYLPNEAVVALSRGEGFAADPLPVWLAGLLVLGYIAVLSALASGVTLRRDVP